jgi:hypothetical protein
MPSSVEIIPVSGLTNAEFLEKYASAGCVGLVGGDRLVNRTIGYAQRHGDENKRPSRWSHAFLFQGRRADGHHWVVESDLEYHRKHLRLGVQENRAEKFHDEAEYARVAVVDFGLTDERLNAALGAALDMVASRTRYSLRELVGTLIALRHPELRSKPNPLDKDHSAYCSAFVRLALMRAGLDALPGVEPKHTTPEDIFRSPLAARIWLLERKDWAPTTPSERLKTRVKNLREAVKNRRVKKTGA